MLAIDMTTGVLIGGIVVLCATTVITALTLPSFSPQWRRRRRPPTVILPATSSRSPVAGQPATPAFALPAAPGRTATVPDRPDEIADVDTAWALIERLLEHDPGRLVDVLHSWITEALDERPDDTKRQTRTPS